MPENKELHILYNSLKRDNYDVPDNYDSFERTLTDSKGGASSRRALYETLKNDNYDVPDSYESFDHTLFPVDDSAAARQPPVTQPSMPAVTVRTKPKASPAQQDEPGIIERALGSFDAQSRYHDARDDGNTAFTGGMPGYTGFAQSQWGFDAARQREADEDRRRQKELEEYQALENERNRKVADFGRLYDEALTQAEKNGWKGTDTIDNAARRYLDSLYQSGTYDEDRYGSEGEEAYTAEVQDKFNREALEARNLFLQRKARDMAAKLVGGLKGDTADEIQENLREAYYNKDNITALDRMRKVAGGDADGYYRDFMQNYYQPAIQEALKEKFNGLTLPAPGLSWDFADIKGSTGKGYDERWMNADEQALIDSLLGEWHEKEKALAKAGQEAYGRTMDKETKENMAIGGREGHAMQLSALTMSERAKNYAKDPSKAIDDILNKLYSQEGQSGSNGGRQMEGIDRQAIGNLLYRRIMKELVGERVPRSKWGYVLEGFVDSDLGQLLQAYTKTSFEKHLDNLANSQYVKTLDGFTGLLAQGGYEVTRFIGDAWEYYFGGKVGSAVTGAMRKRAVAALTDDIMKHGAKNGVKREVARGIAERVFAQQSVAQKAFTAGVHGAATIGAAEAIGSGIRQGLSPAAGEKKAEIQERRANGETISQEQEDKEIAQADADAHSVGTIVGTGVKGGISGAITGFVFAGGTLAGDTVSKIAGRYMGDVKSAALGYVVRLNANATGATVLNRAEGAITGEQPEGSFGQQYVSNLVNFAMLDAQSALPRLLNPHPIRTFRQMKEYERSMGITEADEDRMRDLGYGDLIDTIERIAPRGNSVEELDSSKIGPSGSGSGEVVDQVNRRMLDFLADPRLSEEDKRKYYTLVTGKKMDLSPVTSSEVTQDDEGGYHLVTRNAMGDIVSDREYRNARAAQDAQKAIAFDVDQNATSALEHKVFEDKDKEALENAYNQAAADYNEGKPLTELQRSIVYLHQHVTDLENALNTMHSGGELSPEARALVQAYKNAYSSLFKDSPVIRDIASQTEEAYNLGKGGLDAARKGHSGREARKIAAETGDDVVHVGGAVWRTATEDAAVKDYQQRLYGYMTEVEGGESVDAPGQGKIEGTTQPPTGDNGFGGQDRSDGQTPPPTVKSNDTTGVDNLLRQKVAAYDQQNGTELGRFTSYLDNGKRLPEGESSHFRVGHTGSLLNSLGINGDIAVSTATVGNRHTKNAAHNLSSQDWYDVINDINSPLAVTKYGDGFRIYTHVKIDGDKSICAGVEVRKVGHDVEITNIKTAFGRDLSKILWNEDVLYPTDINELKQAIAEFSSSDNSRIYPPQPSTTAKLGNNSDNAVNNSENVGIGGNQTDNTNKQDSSDIKPVGKGSFGNVYDQFKGKVKEAVNFLKRIKSGEAKDVLWHDDIGNISLVWGNASYGLEHILAKHPNVLDGLQDRINEMHVVSNSDNRIVLESNTHRAVVSKDWLGAPTGQWLLTAYDKKGNGVSGGSIDIVPEPLGGLNGTAPQSGSNSTAKLVNNGESVVKDSEKVSLSDGANGSNRLNGYAVASDVKPVGNGIFGNIYDQFKGKVKEAVDFLIMAKDGIAKGVLHRDGVGDVDVIWGDDKRGLRHIIMRHVVEQSDFDSVDDLVNVIDETVRKGKVGTYNDNVVFNYEGNRVVAVKTGEGQYVLTAYDTTRTKGEKKRAEADATRLYHDIFDNGDGNLVPQSSGTAKLVNNGESVVKDSEKVSLSDGSNRPNQSNGSDGSNVGRGELTVDGSDIGGSLSERRERSRARGAAVDEDESQLAVMQEEADLANQRFNDAFADGKLAEFQAGMIKAIEDDDEDAMLSLLERYGDRLSEEQMEATMGLVDMGSVAKGIEDCIARQSMEFMERRQQELAAITGREGFVTKMALNDGSTVYLKSGDLTNEYGGVIAADADGNMLQVPVRDIVHVETPANAQELLDKDTNDFADGLGDSYRQLAEGSAMLPGQKATISIAGETFGVTMEVEQSDGSLQLGLDDGGAIRLTPDELRQAVMAARKADVSGRLAAMRQERAQRERQARYENGIVGLAQGTPDFSHKDTNAEVAAELMRRQDKETGKSSKERLAEIQNDINSQIDRARAARSEAYRQSRWLELNGDIYTDRQRAEKQKAASDARAELADAEQRQRKLGEIRNVYMTQEERRQFHNQRRDAAEKVRQETEKGIRLGGLSVYDPNTGQALMEGQTLSSAYTVPTGEEILTQYETQGDAEMFLQGERDRIMKRYRDGASAVISDVRRQLEDYENGMMELSPSDLQTLYRRQAGARQAEQMAMEQVGQINKLQKQLDKLYMPRSEVKDFSPADQRQSILNGSRPANSPKEMQQRAREAYHHSDMVGRLEDTEPETLEEYVSQNLEPHSINWEGTGSGTTKKRGLQQELGLSRGIGRNYDSNGINYYVAPKGQGMSVDEVAHVLWEERPRQFDGATTQDMRNTLLDLIANNKNARDIRFLTIQNRINELESYERAQEEQEEWYREQEEAAAKARQIEIDTYNDAIEAIIKEDAPLYIEAEEYYDSLRADGLANGAPMPLPSRQGITNQNNDNGSENQRGHNEGRGLDKQPGRRRMEKGSRTGEGIVRREEPDKPDASVEDNAPQRLDAGPTRSSLGGGADDGGIPLQGEARGGVRLTEENRISKLLKNDDIAWINSKFSLHPTPQIRESVPFDDSNKLTDTDNQPALLGFNSPKHSVAKVGNNQGNVVKKGEKVDFSTESDRSYWNVNSAGVFGKNYGNNKKDVWSASEVQNGKSATASGGLQSESQAGDNSTSNGTPPKSSAAKLNNKLEKTDKKPEKVPVSNQFNGYSGSNAVTDLAKAGAVTLSDETDENGRQFVLSPSGELAFGHLGEAEGLPSAPILLSEGMITNSATNDGYGLVHIEARHGEQIRNAGYASVVDFIDDVAKHFETIKKGKVRDGHQTYLMQLTDKHNNTLIVELSKDGSYWNINTAGIFKESYGKNREIVYSRHATANRSTETDGASQGTEHGGTTASSSMTAPSQSNSSSAKLGNNSDTSDNNSENLSPTTPDEAEEGDVLYREVDDEEQARLDAEPTVKVYRAMQEHDGKLYPPMSGRVREEYTTKNGKKRNRWVWREPTAIGRWEQSEEHPERANDDGTFTLDKGNGKTIDAAYNPYIHTSRSPINDQFSSAWSRPELVTVEVEVPLSELSSGYKAEKAKDAVGEVPWKSGPVSSELAAQGNPRLVILSRWDKPVRIVPVEEVADEYAMRLVGTGIAVPFNTVPPALRDALAARGVEIGEPQNGNAGNASRPSYEEWMQGGNVRYREDGIADINGKFNEELQQQIDGTQEKGHVYQLGRPSGELMSTGIPDLPIILQSSILNTKTNDPAHPYSLEEIKDLVRLIQKPIAIFSYGDKEKAQNLMINVKQEGAEGKQFLVGISLRPTVNGKVLEINSVRNVFPKNYHDWIHWINQGKLLRVDGKKEIQDIIDALRINPVDYINKDALNSAAKIVRDFENPVIKGEKDGVNGLNRLTSGSAEEAGKVDVEGTNEKLNADLERYGEGSMGSNEHLTIGMPHGVLASFMPNEEIILRQKVLTKALKKHGLRIEDVKDLPEALSHPIFVFKSSGNTISVLTELKSAGGQSIFVAMELDAHKQLGHEFVEVNDVLSIHGRETENVVNPIVDNDSLVWVDKEKGLQWLSSAKSNSQAIAPETLDSAAKVVRDFENPVIKGEKDGVNGSAEAASLSEGQGSRFTGREQALRDGLVGIARKAGMEIITDVDEGQRVLDLANGEGLPISESRKRALETVSPPVSDTDQQTVISSADGAKVLNDLDKLVKDYENSIQNKEKTFIGSLAKALGAKRHGTKSEYATFETKNGRIITIRLSDHNTTVSQFDDHGELDGISIVVSAKKSEGITNDGNAHVVEFYYDAIKLRKAGGKPLADIARSIKQALYSGEYKDVTGLAERQEVNIPSAEIREMRINEKVRFFRGKNGEAFGFTVGGRIYIDPRYATAETPVHEYTHLWVDAIKKLNPKEWKNIVLLMKGTWAWDYVRKLYPELKTDDEIADEALAHFSGRRGAERARRVMDGTLTIERGGLNVNGSDGSNGVNGFDGEDEGTLAKAAREGLRRLKAALEEFWKNVCDLVGVHFTTAEEVADRAMSDFLRGYDPRKVSRTDELPGNERLRAEASEMAYIVERAKKDGTYMKAPNGKPSNLTPKQWVQVRTKAFKNWFGDWEKAARIGKLRRSDSVRIEYNDQYPLTASAAQKWIKENLRGEYTIDDTGEKVIISRIGAEEVTSHSRTDASHLKSIAGIPQMLKHAIFITEEPNTKGNGKFDSYRYYVVGLDIDGVDYTAKIVIGVKQGKKYYDHRLTEIEKTKLIDQINQPAEDFTAEGNSSKPPYVVGKDTRLISLLQVNSSKFVDENGEPKVFYHNTDNDFSVFDSGFNGSHNDAGWLGDGFYFYGDEHEGDGYGSRKMAVFLNVRDPYYASSDENARLADANSRDASLEFREDVEGDGYDGVYYDGDLRQEAVVFYPNQIKSATDNAGSFSAGSDDIREREGNGGYSDEELSLMNAPVAKWLGKSQRTKAQQKAFAERERKNMKTAVKDMAGRLHLDNVEIVDNRSNQSNRRARAKGYYDKSSGKIVINIYNHRDIEDALQTLLHEGVAHYGLRQLFGEHFDTFLDNVYKAADMDVRRRITELALRKYGGDFHVATEEYLASLAEQTDFENMPRGFWQKVKDFFLDMLHAIGFEGFADSGVTLSDNELRYILWRSYENLREPGRYRSILGEAEDVAKQAELKVGNYAVESLDDEGSRAAEIRQSAMDWNLSEEKDDDGYSFVVRPDGNKNLWNVDKLLSKAGRQKAPVRVTTRTLQHIKNRHSVEFATDYSAIVNFINYVMTHATQLRRGRGRAMFVVAPQSNTDMAAVIKIMPDANGDYYNVETAGYYRKDKWKGNEDVIGETSEPSPSDTASDLSKSRLPNKDGRGEINAEGQPTSSAAKVSNNSYTSANNSEKVEEPEGERAAEGVAEERRGHVSASSAEVKAYPQRVQQWLSKENLDDARGKETADIFELFGNEPQPIAYIPEEYLYTLGDGITDNRIYSGMGYFVDHAVNHHPSISAEKYNYMQDVLSHPDDVKDTNDGIAFIKKIDRWNAVIVNVEKTPDGKIIWHKSFLDQKGQMYKNKPSLLEKKSPADATPSINPTETAVGSKRNVSALGDSYNKDAPAGTTAPAANNEGGTAVAPGESSAAKISNKSDTSANNSEKVSLPNRSNRSDGLNGVNRLTSGSAEEAGKVDVEGTNEKFNADLERYDEGMLPQGFRFDLGYPSAALRSAGFNDLPISMRASLLARKAGDEHHPFEASDLKDLVKAIQKPIAIFMYSKGNMRNLIVDTERDGKHFLVGVTLNYNANGIEINSVSGLFPKESHEWIKWIQDGKAIRIDQKDKVQDLIASLRTNPAESERIGLNLDDVAKIVRDFENPVIKGEKDGVYGFDGLNGLTAGSQEEADGGSVLYRMGDGPGSFADRHRKAVDGKGTVMPGLSSAVVNVVSIPKHSYTGGIAEATRQAMEAAINKYSSNGRPRVLHYNNHGDAFGYFISGSAIRENLNPKQQAKSDNKGVHLAVVEHLDEVIGESIEVEEHPDYVKNIQGDRDGSRVNKDALMHRFYGAVMVDGVRYRVMTLMREDKNSGNGVHAYEVTKVKVLDEGTPSTSSGSRGVNSVLEPRDLISAAKLIKGVEKSYDKGKNLLEESEKADEQVREKVSELRFAAESMGEALGGVAVTLERNGKDGVKGSYDTGDGTVHVNIDEAEGVDDVEATVCHEVLGHEGLKALFGSNEGVDKFGQFIYESAGKALRRKIVDRANDEGYGWDDPLRYSKAAQEVFSDIAADGPANADEFTLWRKVKHYIIRALKRLGIRVRGLLNDKDLRYYVLRTGKALKRWGSMSDKERADAAESGRVMYSRGKPRRKKGEDMAHYIQRLREYEMWRTAEERARDANDPLPLREDYERAAEDEFAADMDEWRQRNGIADDDSGVGMFPRRKDGESPQEYAIRVADYESRLDKWRDAPSVFDYLKRADEMYRQAYEAWKILYDVHEMESVDERLYGNAEHGTLNVEHGGVNGSDRVPGEDDYRRMEVEHNVERDVEREFGDAVGVDTSADGARRQAKLAVIERRKNLESSSAEDAVFIHELCNDIDALAKDLGIKPKDLRWKLVNVIEHPIRQREADAEVERWVEALNRMKTLRDAHTYITSDGVRAAKSELGALQAAFFKHGEKPSTAEGRRAVHDAAVALADKLNEYYASHPIAAQDSPDGGLEATNAAFNDKLSALTESNADSTVFDLGRPSPVLVSGGVPDKPMKLYGNKVIKKSNKHGFAPPVLKDLPKALNAPIAVFNNYQKDGNRSILTEIRGTDGNILVTLTVGRDADVDFNIVSSAFGKSDTGILNWLNKGYATYINKEKALSFLSHLSAPIAAAAANEELSSAAKVVKEFNNPVIKPEKVGSLESTNYVFNDKLAALTESNADSTVFDLGRPSPVLVSGGVPDKPMKLYGNKVIKKSKKHGFAPSVLKDLPKALNAPIAVFNNYQKDGNRSILTEIRGTDGNILVTVTVGKGIDVDFNIVSSVFGKGDNSLVNWLNNGFATYINKEKALNYLYLSAPIAEAAGNAKLSSAAKVVKEFKNPVIKPEKVGSLSANDEPLYNRLYGDDILQVGKYMHKLAMAFAESESADLLAEDPKVKAIVGRIHDWYDNFYHVLEDAGLRNGAGYIADGYINHVWDKEKSDSDAWDKYVENWQRTKSSNMRHREIGTYLDGIEVGLVPKFDDIAQIMSYYSRQNNEAVANNRFLSDLSFLTVSELNKDGEVVRVLPVLNSHHPARFDEERYKMYHVPGVGDVWVLKEVSRRFASIFGTMRTQDIPEWLTKIGRVYDIAGSSLKKLQLSVSGFHAIALSEVAFAQMRPDRGIAALFKYVFFDSVKSGTLPAYAHPEDFKLAASHLVQLGATQDYAAADVNMVTEKFRNFVKGLRHDESFMKQVGGDAMTPFAVALDWINKGTDKLLWNYLHDGLKIACFKMFAEQIDRRVEKEGLTGKQRDRLLDEAGQYVNDTFGGQYWELLNVSPATLKWMRRAFLSPDWLISTQRHFFANFGFGSLYDPRGFAEYLRDQIPGMRSRQNQLNGPEDDGDIYRQFRSRNARLCYILGVCVFYYTMMNALNAVMRARDVEKEKSKADEIRKTNPDYKSPYELAYPDGMKWYDYTMFGNALGQQTHLFFGRYADGTEMYVRWGKQFREFPEMFIGSKGLDFPAPMIQRLMGKANPVIGLLRDNLGALGIWGYENSTDNDEIQRKYGKTIGLLAMNAHHFIPYSLPTQSGKEWKFTDLFMPSSKGFSRYKTIDYFKDFIKSGDMEGVTRTYRSATMNGIDAEKCLQAAISTLKAEQSDEMKDGIVDLPTAFSRYDNAKTLEEKKAVRGKMLKLLAAENYKAFTRADALQMIEDYENGLNVAEKDNDRYIQLSTSSDIRDDYRLSAIGKQAKVYADSINRARTSADPSVRQGAPELRRRYGAWLRIYGIVNHERAAVGKLKKRLGKGDDSEVMGQIRRTRAECQQQVDNVKPPK